MNKQSFHLNLLTSNWQSSHGAIASRWGDPSEGAGNFGFSANKFLAIKSGVNDSLLLFDYTNQFVYFYVGSSEKINALYNSYQGGTPSVTLTSNMWDSYITEWSKDPVLKLLDQDITFMMNEDISILNELRLKIANGGTANDSKDKIAEVLANVGDDGWISIYYLGENSQAVSSDGLPVYVVQKNWNIPKSSPNTIHITVYDDSAIMFDSSTWSKSGLTITNETTILNQSGDANSRLTVVDKSDNQTMNINISGRLGNIWGSEGNDTITDGIADAYIMPFGGNNTINGGDGYDTLDYFSAAPSVRSSGLGVYSLSRLMGRQTSYKGIDGSFITGTVKTATGTDKFTNIESLNGSQYDDRLIGNLADNEFTGSSGNDYIDGGGGIDTINYGNSQEGVLVNISRQSISINKLNVYYIYNDSIRNSKLSAQTAIDGWGNKDIVFNIENINGSDFSDVLIGNDLNNIIHGGWSDSTWQYDNIIGKGGADLITISGSGKVNYENIRDSMPDRNGKELSDVIVAWNVGEIKDGTPYQLWIDLMAIDANSLVSGNQEFQWSTNLISPNTVDKSSEFSGKAGELILKGIVYQPEPLYVGLGQYATEAASIQGDVNGDRIADFEVKIIGVSDETFHHVNVLM